MRPSSSAISRSRSRNTSCGGCRHGHVRHKSIKLMQHRDIYYTIHRSRSRPLFPCGRHGLTLVYTRRPIQLWLDCRMWNYPRDQTTGIRESLEKTRKCPASKEDKQQATQACAFARYYSSIVHCFSSCPTHQWFLNLSNLQTSSKAFFSYWYFWYFYFVY